MDDDQELLHPRYVTGAKVAPRSRRTWVGLIVAGISFLGFAAWPMLSTAFRTIG